MVGLRKELVACVRPQWGQQWRPAAAEELPPEVQRGAVTAAAMVAEAEVAEVAEREVCRALPRGGRPMLASLRLSSSWIWTEDCARVPEAERHPGVAVAALGSDEGRLLLVDLGVDGAGWKLDQIGRASCRERV